MIQSLLIGISLLISVVGLAWNRPTDIWDTFDNVLGTTSFPTSLDSLTNPSATDPVNNPSHSSQHANANDALEALEAKLGITASTPVANSVLSGTGSGSSIWTTYGTTTSLFTTLFQTTNILATGSSTLQNFTFVSATGTKATTTSSFSTTASSTSLFTSSLGVATSSPFTPLAVRGAISATENTMATSSSITIDWRDSNQPLVRMGSGNMTVNFSNYIAGQTIRVVVCNPNSSGGTLTWGDTAILWAGGSAATRTTTANRCDVYSFIATNGTSTLKVFGAGTIGF